MKVAELIASLQNMPQELDVCLKGYEGGYYEITAPAVRVAELAVDVNSAWYYGPHDDPGFSPNAIRRSFVIIS